MENTLNETVKIQYPKSSLRQKGKGKNNLGKFFPVVFPWRTGRRPFFPQTSVTSPPSPLGGERGARADFRFPDPSHRGKKKFFWFFSSSFLLERGKKRVGQAGGLCQQRRKVRREPLPPGVFFPVLMYMVKEGRKRKTVRNSCILKECPGQGKVNR